MLLQKTGEVDGRRLGRGQNLNPVAGGNDHAFGYAGDVSQGAGDLGQFLAGDGDALTQFDGSGLVIHANDSQGHWAPYLWTWLSMLAAHTASITTKTPPET